MMVLTSIRFTTIPKAIVANTILTLGEALDDDFLVVLGSVGMKHAKQSKVTHLRSTEGMVGLLAKFKKKVCEQICTHVQ